MTKGEASQMDRDDIYAKDFDDLTEEELELVYQDFRRAMESARRFAEFLEQNMDEFLEVCKPYEDELSLFTTYVFSEHPLATMLAGLRENVKTVVEMSFYMGWKAKEFEPGDLSLWEGLVADG